MSEDWLRNSNWEVSSENLKGPSLSARNGVPTFDESKPLSKQNSADADDLRSKLNCVRILQQCKHVWD